MGKKRKLQHQGSDQREGEGDAGLHERDDMPHGEQRGAALQDGSLPENWELQDKRSTVSTSTRERERERERILFFFFLLSY